MPLRFDQYAADDEKILRMVLFSVIESNNSALADWFVNFGEEEEYRYVHTDEVYKKIETMTAAECMEVLKRAALKLSNNEGEQFRELMAVHLGADIEKEFTVTQEYLEKKTKAEIIEFGEKYKLFDAVEVQTFLYEKLLKKRGKVGSCKKSELIRLVLESGVDLVGKVPDEIMKAAEE